MIPVRNIYWMLAYAFRALRKGTYERLGTEEFDNSLDLCAAILTHGIESQVKRGLNREYSLQTKALSSLQGKVDVTTSLKTSLLLKHQLVCNFDEFTADTPANRIIKSTAILLLRDKNVSPSRKKTLRRLLPYMSEVREVNLRHYSWDTCIGHNNQDYHLLLFVCRLIGDGLLMTEQGKSHASNFFDNQVACRLYEKFILEYYRREHPKLTASATQVPWALDNNFVGALPIMQTDITLWRDNKVHIIDTKYYTNMMQNNYGTSTLHSGNLYQIFTYVKNMQASLPVDAPAVSGMLMYARTDEKIMPDGDYLMSGNPISVRSLDLSCEFENVREQLDAVVEEVFGLITRD